MTGGHFKTRKSENRFAYFGGNRFAYFAQKRGRLRRFSDHSEISEMSALLGVSPSHFWVRFWMCPPVTFECGFGCAPSHFWVQFWVCPPVTFGSGFGCVPQSLLSAVLGVSPSHFWVQFWVCPPVTFECSFGCVPQSLLSAVLDVSPSHFWVRFWTCPLTAARRIWSIIDNYTIFKDNWSLKIDSLIFYSFKFKVSPMSPSHIINITSTLWTGRKQMASLYGEVLREIS